MYEFSFTPKYDGAYIFYCVGDYDVEGFETFMTDDSDGVEKVIVIPTKIPPHKTVNYMASEADRVTMCKLATEGLERVEELEKNWQNSTSAFIAMWFDNETQNYRTVVEEAIRKAGYDPKIIDSYEHNNFIMDEVINQINEAKFVIADFTCVPERPERNSKIPGGVRGGVYFEAGYAKGLGKEVIVTCKDSDEAKKRRHFDIDQLNTLFWREGEDGKLYDANNIDFVYRLTERIKATVGKGTL